jgi:hypothetical protein
MLAGLFIIKAVAVVLTFSGLGYFMIKRFKSNKNKEAQFKHNVSLMREEKLLIHTDKKQQKRRQRLIKKPIISDDVNQKQLMNKSKKLGVPVGEILLAAKIQMSCN